MEKEQETTQHIVEDKDKEIDSLIPSMNVNLPAETKDEPAEEAALISDEALLGVYGEVLTNLREDRLEVDQILSNFVDMVINEGDSTTSSKEALVNLLRMKMDSADKMAKIADLMTRVKVKERDTFPRYLAANQNNTINIGDNGQKRALLEAINKVQKNKKDEGKK